MTISGCQSGSMSPCQISAKTVSAPQPNPTLLATLLLIERCVGWLKERRRLATRYMKSWLSITWECSMWA